MRLFTIQLVLCISLMAPDLVSAQGDITFEKFSKTELTAPIELAHAGDDRIFVVNQYGKIHIVTNDGTVLPTPFLDITDRVLHPSDYSQIGLLGLDFHPKYAVNGKFYVYYIGLNRITTISEFSVSSSDPNLADKNSEVKFLEYAQPPSNKGDDHKGGCVKFGKDGYLYVTSGDGGKGTNGINSQDLTSYLGKMIRLKVDGDGTFSFPSDNPFINNANANNGIWAYGLRNPWIFSFDRLNGDLYLADVGADRWDEINYQPAGAVGGVNYGWPCFEADEVWEDLPSTYVCPNMSETGTPILTFFQTAPVVKVSITGGYVYRGSATPYYNGYYIYAEAYSNEVFYAHKENNAWIKESFGDKDLFLTTFGEGADGELYALGIYLPPYSEAGNNLYKVKLSAPTFDTHLVLSSTAVTVNELGSSEMIGVKLDYVPTSNVVLNISNSDATEANVSPSSLTFTPANALTEQQVTIAGLDDPLKDGNVAFTITLSVDKSLSSIEFQNTEDAVIRATNIDDDSQEIRVGASEISLVENGNDVTIGVKLSQLPTGDVILNVSNLNPEEVNVTPTTLTFTSINALDEQNITFMAVDDHIEDGDFTVLVSISVDLVNSVGFQNAEDQTITVTKLDDDKDELIISETVVTVTESGNSQIVGINLGTIPDGIVVLKITSSDVNEVTVSKTSLTFSAENALFPQTISIKGVDDEIADEDANVTVSIAVDAANSTGYLSVDPKTILVTNTADGIVLAINDPLSKIEIFPNPAHSTFIIQGLSQNIGFEISDLSGKLLYNRSAYSGSSVTVDGLKSGLYLVRFYDEISQKSVVQKLIIQ